MMKKRIKTGGALILAAVLAISAFALPKAFAAVEVNVGADCDLTVDVRGAGYSELISDSIIVDLYKVADITVTGAYSSLVNGVSFNDIDFETTAKEWEDMATAIVSKLGELEITYSEKTDGGVVKFEDIDTGLYLVYAEQMLSAYNQYDFKPYLISLPNNYWNNYAKDNEIPETAKDETGKVTDEWIYDFTVSLKPSKSDRYGDLLIDKTVDVFNETLGEANFVFQVEAEKTDIDTGAVTKVYSNVVSLEFNGIGSKQVLIEDIPAGAVVTVTEVYSGASYQFDKSEIKETAEEGKLVIIAGDEDEETVDLVAEIEFFNTYNKGLNGGNAVVNEFAYSAETGSYSHTKANDSATPEE